MCLDSEGQRVNTVDQSKLGLDCMKEANRLLANGLLANGLLANGLLDDVTS